MSAPTSTPDFSHLTAQPSTADFATPEPDFGPDANAAPPENPFENIPLGTARTPRDKRKQPRASRNLFAGKDNATPKPAKEKVPQSSVRALTQADAEKIAEYYSYLAMGAMWFRPATAEALADQANDCAEAWMDLARKNPRVRKAVVTALEGGALTKLTVAHLPILLTLMPAGTMEKLMQARMKKFMHTDPNADAATPAV